METWTCNGQTDQQWMLNADGTITGVESGHCLDVTGGAGSAGSLVPRSTCNGGSSRRWTPA